MKKLIILILLALSSITYGQLSQINVGTSANDGTGESIRSAFQKVNLGITQINTNTDSLKLKLNKGDTLTLSNRINAKLDITSAISYPGSGIPLSTGSAWGTSITNNSSNWNTAYSDRLKWDGGSTGLTAATGRSSLGGTTAGQALFTLTNPSAITFLRINADNSVTALSAANFKTALSLSATDVGLGNVTNESKATMFTNPTFTGTVKLDTIGENISANGIVMKGELTITGTDKKTGYFYAGTNAPTSSTRLNYDGNLWVNWLYPAVIKYGRPGVDNIVTGVDPHTSGLSNRVSSNSVANLYIDASNSQDGIGGVGGTNIGFIINNVMKFSSKATQNESSVKLLVDDIGEYTTGHSVVFASIPKVSTTDTLSTKAYARSVGLGGGGGVSEATVSAIVSDSIVARLNGATKISDVAVMLADTVPIVTFSLGAGLPADTACFNNGVLAGSFYNEGSDTLKITQLMGILKEGTGTETIAVQVAWHATFLSGSATNLNSSALTVNSLTTGTEDTSFANAKIPPNVFVWCILSGASKNNKPTFMNVTLSGYKIPKY